MSLCQGTAQEQAVRTHRARFSFCDTGQSLEFFVQYPAKRLCPHAVSPTLDYTVLLSPVHRVQQLKWSLVLARSPRTMRLNDVTPYTTGEVSTVQHGRNTPSHFVPYLVYSHHRTVVEGQDRPTMAGGKTTVPNIGRKSTGQYSSPYRNGVSHRITPNALLPEIGHQDASPLRSPLFRYCEACHSRRRLRPPLPCSPHLGLTEAPLAPAVGQPLLPHVRRLGLRSSTSVVWWTYGA